MSMLCHWFSNEGWGRPEPPCVRSKFLGGEGVVDGVGGSSERCLKWGGGGSLRDLSKNILK